MPVAMVNSPHVDDAAAICSGILAKFVEQDCWTILVCENVDRKDSLGLGIMDTISRNTKQFHEAAAIIGIDDIIEPGFETDMLGDIRLGQLRERLVYLFRMHAGYAVFSFDHFGLYENNDSLIN